MDLARPVSLRVLHISKNPRHWLAKSMLKDEAVVPVVDLEEFQEIGIWAGSPAECSRRLKASAQQRRSRLNAPPAKKLRMGLRARNPRPRQQLPAPGTEPGPQRGPRAAAGSRRHRQLRRRREAEDKELYDDGEPSQPENSDEAASENLDCEAARLSDASSPSASSWDAESEVEGDTQSDPGDGEESEDASASPGHGGDVDGRCADSPDPVRRDNPAGPGYGGDLDRHRADSPERVQAVRRDNPAPARSADAAVERPKARARSTLNRTVLDLGELGDVRFYHMTGVMTQ
eukprot:s1666_g8.t1